MFLSKRYYEKPNIIKFNERMNTYNVEKLKKKRQDLSRKFLKSVLPKANSNNLLYCKLNLFFYLYYFYCTLILNLSKLVLS